MIAATFAVVFASFSPAMLANDDGRRINIFTRNGAASKVRSIPADSLVLLRHSEAKVPEGAFPWFKTLVAELADGSSLSFPLDSVKEVIRGEAVPAIRLVTDRPLYEIASKTDYETGRFSISAFGFGDDVEAAEVNIRGRGNSTWGLPKKPYRLKFNKKISLCGMKKAKNYCLIANYIDPTLMRNSVAFKIAELLQLPFTNHSVPVDVWLNDSFKGAYMLTEKIGINSGSVDIDESEGILWELDTNYDEDYKFTSSTYGTKVMVKDPDFMELADGDEALAESMFASWKADYEAFEQAVARGKWSDALDAVSAVDYMLVYLLSGNREINFPKSTYMYKNRTGERYRLGPVWDFDWGFDHSFAPDYPLFGDNKLNVLWRVARDPDFQTLLRARWETFKADSLPLLFDYIKDYAASIRASALINGERWPSISGDTVNPDSSETFDSSVLSMLHWIEKRIEYIDSSPTMGLY